MLLMQEKPLLEFGQKLPGKCLPSILADEHLVLVGFEALISLEMQVEKHFDIQDPEVKGRLLAIRSRSKAIAKRAAEVQATRRAMEKATQKQVSYGQAENEYEESRFVTMMNEARRQMEQCSSPEYQKQRQMEEQIRKMEESELWSEEQKNLRKITINKINTWGPSVLVNIAQALKDVHQRKQYWPRVQPKVDYMRLRANRLDRKANKSESDSLTPTSSLLQKESASKQSQLNQKQELDWNSVDEETSLNTQQQASKPKKQ